MKDIWGRLPLHTAASFGVDGDIVRALVQHFPEATIVEDLKREIPLHSALQNGHFETAATFLDEHLGEIDALDALALIKNAIREKAPPLFFEQLTQKVPHGFRMRGEDGNLPLHTAIFNSTGGQIDVIINAYPEAIRIQNARGNIPLHIATFRAPDPVFIQRLVDGYPEGCSIRNESGNLPIHCVMANGTATQSLMILHNQFPQGLVAVNNEGNTPLHCHLGGSESNTSVVEMLLNLNASSARMMNNSGEIPLHVAAREWGCGVESLRMLVDAFPRSLQSQCDKGNFPLHCALSSLHYDDAAKERVDFLLNADRAQTGRVNFRFMFSPSIS